jgi:chromosome partitioning protein
MAKVVAIINPKGGVGKTTTALNLGACLVTCQRKTLVVDLDPQGSATSGLGADLSRPGSDALLKGAAGMEGCTQRNVWEQLDIIGCGPELMEVERLLGHEPPEAEQLTQWANFHNSSWDYVLIDCPPSRGVLTEHALGVADEFLLPIQCEYFGMEGLAQAVGYVRKQLRWIGKPLGKGNILLTMFDPSEELSLAVRREVRKHFREWMLRAVVPRDIALAEATSHGVPAIDYSPRSRGVRAYMELALEVQGNG